MSAKERFNLGNLVLAPRAILLYDCWRLLIRVFIAQMHLNAIEEEIMNGKLNQIDSAVRLDCKAMHSKCKATCCGVIDFDKEFWEIHQHKVITKPIKVIPFPDGRTIMPETESGYCPFLNEDYHCNIYEDRPNVCREYGDGSTPYMSCPFLRRDGSQRSRQEKRYLQRSVDKKLKSLNLLASKLPIIQ
jgi:Fe-S-cluster containining protein